MVGVARGQEFGELMLGRAIRYGIPTTPILIRVGMGVMGCPFAQPGRMSLYLSSDPSWSRPCIEVRNLSFCFCR